DALWERAFGRSPRAIGATVTLGTESYTVVGVAPRGFRGTELGAEPQLWAPVTMVCDVGAGPFFAPDNRERVFTGPTHMLRLTGRLRDGRGATAEHAAAQLNAILHRV